MGCRLAPGMRTIPSGARRRLLLALGVTLAAALTSVDSGSVMQRAGGRSGSIAAPTDAPRADPVAHALARVTDDLAYLTDPPATVETTPDPTVASTPTPTPTPEPTPAPTPLPTPRSTPRPTVRTAAPPVVDTSTQAAELRMLGLINGSRTASGLVALTLDANVSATARAHSRVEAQVGYVYHDGPDGTATARDSAACGTGWYGENTGKIWNGNVDALHIEFMSEPWVPIDHRTILMDPQFRRVGVGAVQGSDALYMTMVFCR